METDGYDPYDDVNEQSAKERAARQLYDRGIFDSIYLDRIYTDAGGAGGARFISGDGGGGGGGGFFQAQDTWWANPQPITSPVPPYQVFKFQVPTEPTPEERQEMNWTNPEAANIAREILNDEKREGLRETVTAAVALYRDMLADAHCGSVYSFMKINEDGKHYWYAAIKNGGKWYTTAQNPRVIEGDDEFITWLISLGAHESQAAELTVGAANYAHELGPIDATSTDKS